MHYTLITGSSFGLGLKLCIALAKRGHNLILVSRKKERLNKICNTLTAKYNIKAIAIKADLSSEKELKQLISKLDKFNINLLVNCAGVLNIGESFKTNFSKDLESIYTNLLAPITLSKYFTRRLIATKQKGSIINICSLASIFPHPYMASYSATKAGLFSYSLALSYELRKYGIHCLTVCPAPLDTNMTKQNNAKYPKVSTKLATSFILKALDKKKNLLIFDTTYKLLIHLLFLLPLTLRVKIIGFSIRKGLK